VTSGVRSARTKYNYRQAFSYFLKYLRITDPSPLLQEDPRILEAKIIVFIIAENKKLSHNSIKTFQAAVKRFFDMKDIPLNKRKISKCIPAEENAKEDLAYTHEEVQKILAASDEPSRIALLLMASTGMRMAT
jgi:hypothetical protein